MPMELKEVNERIRPGVKLIAEIGGFSNDYHAVINGKYKNEMFLYDVSSYIENKKYKAIIESLKLEYPFMNFDKKNGTISDDEKLVRKTLRGSGFIDDDFYNPKFDKNELVQWQNNLYKIKNGFKDSGVNLYSLTDLTSGGEVGGRLREDELSEPTDLQKIIYYKRQGMLDVHLFNKIISTTNEFDISKCKIERNNYSVTQGGVKLFYDGEEFFGGPLDAEIKLTDLGWVGKSDEHWNRAIQDVYENGNFLYILQQEYPKENRNIDGVIEPLKYNYGLREQIQFLDALKGIDVESCNQQIREVAYASQKGFIGMNAHYNVLAMLSHDTKAPVKLPNMEVSVQEILELEKLAIRKLKNDDFGSKLQGCLDELKKEPKVIKELSNESIIKIDGIFKKGMLFEYEVSSFSGSANYPFSQKETELRKKIDKFCDEAYSFVMERDILKLQRPDLENLIKSANLYLDGAKEELVIFRSACRNDGFEWGTIEASINKEFGQCWAELDIADNGFRREFYFAPTVMHQGGAIFGYCEGDLSLIVPKDKMDFEARLDSDIKFYIEDLNRDAEQFDDIKNEISLKLGLIEHSVKDYAERCDDECGTLSSIVLGNKTVRDYL